MPLSVKLTKNDNTEEFVIQASRVSRALDQSIVQEAVLETYGSLTGSDPELNTVKLELSGLIQDVAAADYPNSGTYTDDDFGFENEIQRAGEEWGPSAADGFTVFTWDGRTIDVVITNVETEENLDERKQRSYTLDITLQHIDIYTG